MKKIVSSVIIICMLLMSFCNICYAATFQPTITAESGSVGDTITVTISLPANTNAAGGSFNLIYDNTKMELVDATAGDIISAFSKTVNKTYAANKVRLNFAGSETVSASGGVVLNATFRLTASGTATFSTEKFKLADIDTNYLTCANSTQNITITSGATSSAFTPTITAENGTIGDTINVAVSIPANTNAAGGSFNLVYDNTKMELVDATAGDIITAFSKTVNKTYAENKVRLNFAGSETISASGGIVLNAIFKLTASGTATFSIEKFKLADIDTNYLTCENASKSIAITAPSTTVAVTGVSLNKTSTTLKIGEAETFTATITPSDATNKNVTWSSSNTGVATVSNGKVTAVGEGTATITVTTADGGKTATCVVAVEKESQPEPSVPDENMPVLTVVKVSGRAGESVTVPLTIANNSGIAGMLLKLTYDERLTLESLVQGDALTGLVFTPPGNLAENNLSLPWDGQDDDKTNGTALVMTFKLPEDAEDENVYEIKISYNMGDIYDNDLEDIEVSIVNGNITVKNYTIGDVNDDGIINTKDITLLRRGIAGGYGVTLNEAADVNCDDIINTKDITILRRYIAGGYGVVLGK